MKKFYLFLVVTLALSLCQITANAQTTTGRLVGTVAGADGAVIPGASVVLKDLGTGKEATATTNGEGGFEFPLLDYGNYSVKVTSKGFKTTTATIKIEVGKEYSLPLTLDVGDVSENVTVTAGADVVNSTNGELTSTISNRQITELPLATRNPLALILTQAGSSSNPSQNTSVNGGRTSSTNITRDGVNIQDNFIRSNATDFSPGRPSVDNVEEFTLSSQSAVDTGFGAAQVNLVTPRGGNRFHGAVWEYNRNSKFGANTWFANASGSYGPNDASVIAGVKKAGDERNPRPFRNRNQYGAKVSGPIFKNKLFFFAFGERLKDIVNSSRLATVLTPTARQGIFRYQVGSNIYSVNVFAPGVLQTGISGLTPPTGINPVANTLFLQNMPLPNSYDTGDQLNTLGYRFFQRADQDRDALTSRVDYDLNANNNINFVIDYNYEKNLRSDLGGLTTIPLVIQPARNVVYSAGWRFSPTANISNEFRIGRFYSEPVFSRTDAPASEYYTLPLVSNPLPLNGSSPFLNQGRAVKTFNMQDTMGWIWGNHSFRLGAQYQDVKINSYNDGGIVPTYGIGFSGAGPTLNNTNFVAAAGPGATLPNSTVLANARSLAALLGGVIGSGQQTYNVTSQDSGYVAGATAARPFSFKAIAPYIVDQWKLTPSFTVNVGLRYDYYTALKADTGLLWEPTIAPGQTARDAVLNPNGTFQFIGGNAGAKNTFYHPDKNNWAPSISAAWAPKNFKSGLLKAIAGEAFVLRGGYRVSYVNDELVTAPNNALANQPGFSTTVAALNTYIVGGSPVLTSSIDDRLGAAHLSGLNPGTFLTTRNYLTNNTASFSNFGTAFAVDPYLQTPSQHDYTFGIQRQFGSWVGEARYVGSYSKNMLRTIDYNQIMIPTQYATDFNLVRANLLAGCPAANGGTTGSARACANGTVLFNQMGAAGNYGNVTPGSTFGTLVNQGQIAELAFQQLSGGQIPNPNTFPVPSGTLRAQFLPNPNIGVANVLENGGHYNYNALQVELRRQFSKGLYLQANYTFSKELTDAIGTSQTRVEPFLDNNNRSLDYTRADYDQTHIFNLNAIYELPFGKGKRWMTNKYMDYAFGGWQLGLVWRVASGAPITFTDARGTLNRSGRSGRQTALTNLTQGQLAQYVGIFKTPCGIYMIDPAVININQQALAAGQCSSLNSGIASGTVGGAAASGFGSNTFNGQIFFNNGPLQTSGLRRAVVNGPTYSSADISLLKNFRITEGVTFQVRGEAYNFLNTPYFAPGQVIDINSTSFGKVSSSAVGARVIQFAGRLTF